MRKTYQEKLKEFAQLGPFRYLDSGHYAEYRGEYTWYPSDPAKPSIEFESKPACAACGSRRAYWFIIAEDRQGKPQFIGQDCWQRLAHVISPADMAEEK